jgi:hypothetical protein
MLNRFCCVSTDYCDFDTGMAVLLQLDTNLQTFEAYIARFRMPLATDSSGSATPQLYYSVDIASVHWIILSSYSDFDSTSAQYAWLQNDLATLNRTITPWVFVMLHAPWYVLGCRRCVILALAAFSLLFVDVQV